MVLRQMVRQNQGLTLMNTTSPISVPIMAVSLQHGHPLKQLAGPYPQSAVPSVRSVCILKSAMYANAYGMTVTLSCDDGRYKTHAKRLTSIDDVAKAAIISGF